ncbi:hypothetical protein GCM10011374_40170 [Kocuria dechangensis]|uniref:Uncharacterized protein n=1 Tax=Kocuria dechangensis TaxID=1176249 RepID=A0A917H9E2_9MICC|nr:hypothetical protein [Kocuria dechangensis]GGG71460.1 hypothetical protein GCM10011374_40170 [Kocuria dechangensis]
MSFIDSLLSANIAEVRKKLIEQHLLTVEENLSSRRNGDEFITVHGFAEFQTPGVSAFSPGEPQILAVWFNLSTADGNFDVTPQTLLVDSHVEKQIEEMVLDITEENKDKGWVLKKVKLLGLFRTFGSLSFTAKITTFDLAGAQELGNSKYCVVGIDWDDMEITHLGLVNENGVKVRVLTSSIPIGAEAYAPLPRYPMPQEDIERIQKAGKSLTVEDVEQMTDDRAANLMLLSKLNQFANIITH